MFSVAVLGPRFQCTGSHSHTVPWTWRLRFCRPSGQAFKNRGNDAWIRKLPAREFTAIVAKAYEDDGYVVATYSGAAELLVEKETVDVGVL